MPCPFHFEFEKTLACIRKRPMSFPIPLAIIVWQWYGAQFTANGVEFVTEGNHAVFRMKERKAPQASATVVKIIA